MSNSDTNKPDIDEDEISDEMQLFLEILAHPDFDKTEFNNSLRELEIEPDEEFPDCSHRLQ